MRQHSHKWSALIKSIHFCLIQTSGSTLQHADLSGNKVGMTRLCDWNSLTVLSEPYSTKTIRLSITCICHHRRNWEVKLLYKMVYYTDLPPLPPPPHTTSLHTVWEGCGVLVITVFTLSVHQSIHYILVLAGVSNKHCLLIFHKTVLDIRPFKGPYKIKEFCYASLFYGNSAILIITQSNWFLWLYHGNNFCAIPMRILLKNICTLLHPNQFCSKQHSIIYTYLSPLKFCINIVPTPLRNPIIEIVIPQSCGAYIITCSLAKLFTTEVTHSDTYICPEKCKISNKIVENMNPAKY